MSRQAVRGVSLIRLFPPSPPRFVEKKGKKPRASTSQIPPSPLHPPKERSDENWQSN